VFSVNRFVKIPVPELVSGGPDFFRRFHAMIWSAKESVHLQMYAIEPDGTGQKVIEELMLAARRGVKVYVLLDAFGSKDLPAAWIKTLKDSGVNFRFFSPLSGRKTLRLGRRLHHKILVADGNRALIGGINIGDKYHGGEFPPWLDYALEVSGNGAQWLEDLCVQIWGRRFFKGRIRPVPTQTGLVLGRATTNDWFRRKTEISRALRKGILEAEKEVLIITPYFLPGRKIRKAIRLAAKKKVAITLVLPGLSDVVLAKRAARFLYPWLMRKGVKILEWNKSVLHAKLIVADRKWISLGSYNINHLSDYSSIETNFEILDEKFADASLDRLSEEILNHCHPIEQSDYDRESSWWRTLVDRMSFVLVRFLMRLLFSVTTRS
jgi:cardiolipin synthase A/B